MPELQNSPRPEAVVTVVNRKGLHARASAKFVRLAEGYNAVITVTRDGQSVGGTSIMGLMMLAAGPGSRRRLRFGPTPVPSIASTFPCNRRPESLQCLLE